MGPNRRGQGYRDNNGKSFRGRGRGSGPPRGGRGRGRGNGAPANNTTVSMSKENQNLIVDLIAKLENSATVGGSMNFGPPPPLAPGTKLVNRDDMEEKVRGDLVRKVRPQLETFVQRP